MTIATALVSGNDALPYLAEQAAVEAVQKSGSAHATGVLLFLSHEFALRAQQAVTAVARATQCTQIAGGIASGVFTDAGWVVDRPAVAVMVLGGNLSLGLRGRSCDTHALLSYAGARLPPDWRTGDPRFGGNFNSTFSGAGANANERLREPVAWQQARLNEQQQCSVQLLGAQIDVAVSSGLKLVGTPQRVERCNGFDLERLGGQSAARNLRGAIRSEQLDALAHPLHQIAAIRIDSADASEQVLATGCYRTAAVIAANADESLTLSERIKPGEWLCWALRQPTLAEADMRETLDRLVANQSSRSFDPACALMFSCIGRGPYFYGGDDRDLAILRERFPKLPVIGTYSTGQIAPVRCGNVLTNRQLQNSVVTAFATPVHEETHVQSIT